MDEEEKGQSDYDIVMSDEYVLTDIEKNFILAAERGDCSTVRRIIQENVEKPNVFNINCVDPLNRSALISAIENENYDLIVLLLDEGIQVGDALLHAISEEYVEAVEELLQWEEQNHREGDPYSWEAVDRSKSNFTPDITPLILAAHRNNYEILKILLDRGATLPMPHDVKCGCDDCVTSQDSDSLRYSQSRINAYRALSASSLIALSSRDPVLTAFQLSWELKRLQAMESEFRVEYTEMREGVQQFVTALLDHARTSTELEIMLNYNHEIGTDIWIPGQRQTLDRLKLAIKYKQKLFVAHPNVQQLLAAIWYEGLPGFRRKTPGQQVMDVAKLGCMFPVYSMNYLMNPDSEMGKFMKKPFVKFISYSASYAIFLMLLTAASLRVVQMMFEMIGFPWMLEMLDNWKRYERGGLPGPIELGIIMYIGSLIFGELTALYTDGLLDYISDLWNIVDFISNFFYVTWILCRVTAWIIVHRDLWYRGIDPYFPREHWHQFDPMLLSEGAFAAGMIFSFLKLVHIFSINPHLGPLQVSLGRMIIDIIKFFFIYTLVLFAFACGFNQLLWYYADLEKHKCYHLHPEVADFDDQEKACTIWRRFANLFETSQSLFWASFGLVDLVSFDLAGIKSFTRFWALLLFGSYSVINIIVLLNMLIAMMSNSYQIISERADTEWKFARSQLWMSYFEDGGTVPPPFNICPSMKLLKKTLGREKKRTKSFMRKTRDRAQEMHDKVMKLLVRRYVTAEQRKRDDFGITEDDIIEVRQDISSLRFELLDIFKNNRMEVPDIDKKQANNAGTKKGKVLERRILKDFQIGFVEGLAAEMTNDTGPTDVFGSIAKVIGKGKASLKGDAKKKDWNAIARKNTMSQDPIGSKRSSLQRRSKRSLRRQIIDEANAGLKMDTDQIVEYNPKLVDEKPATRVAYVKFMQKTLTKREESDLKEKENSEKSETKGKSVRLQTMRSIKDTKTSAPTPLSGDGKQADDVKSRDTTSSMKASVSGVNFKEPTKPPEKPKDAAKADESATKPSSLTKKPDEKSPTTGPPTKTPAPSVPKPDTKTGEAKPPDTKPEAPKPPGSISDPKSGVLKPSSTKDADKKPSNLKSEETKTSSTTGKPAESASKPGDGKPSDSKAGDGKAGDGKAGDGKAGDGKAGDGKAGDGKGGDGKAGDGKAGDSKAGDSKAGDGKASSSKPSGSESGESKSSNGKSTDSKPSDDKTGKTPSDAKPGDTKPVSSKPDDKKPPPPRPEIKVGQSSAAAGGDRGKSTVTGRMISGWL